MGSASSKSPAKAPLPGTAVGAGEPDSNLDPRSPTPDVARTPLKENSTLKHNITKNADLSTTLDSEMPEEMLIHNNPIFSAVIRKHLQSYDPRSPAQDFERTPITLPFHLQSSQKQMLRLQTNPDDSISFPEMDQDPQNVLDGESTDHLSNELHSLSMSSSLPEPEPLGSSTASQEAIDHTVTALTPPGLLETNFDYIETNVDKFDTPEQNMLMKVALRKRFEIIKSDPRSPSQGIERTPIVVSKTENTSTESIQESVEEMSDECLVRVLQSTTDDFRSTLARVSEKNKQSLLIYEDDATKTSSSTPANTRSASNSGSRTPLSCVKNKADERVRSQSANALTEARKRNVSKIPKRVSNIPRLQSASKLAAATSEVALKDSASALQDYENTPPHSHRDVWDKDTSVVL